MSSLGLRAHLDALRVSHPCVRFTEADHALELASRGGDAAVVTPRVCASVAHLDVGGDERVGGFRGQDRLDVVPSPRDVGGEVLDFLWRKQAGYDLPERF